MWNTLTQKAIDSILEAKSKYNLELYDVDYCSITLISIEEIYPVYKIEIEMQNDKDYMVRINNGHVETEIPLELLNDYIIDTIEKL